ncbi:hypothetical protein ANO11243_001340 [Dothideomycetidae sp. 11243]|nr:hypothetical protein ANO11243_001340 [fungal sp. No.11243]
MWTFSTVLQGITSLLAVQNSNSGSRPAFDAREATVASVRHALITGQATCRQIVEVYLSRIAAINPIINAVLSLDPDVLVVADILDAKLADPHYVLPPLFCVPVLIKDNFDVEGMATTGGCAALAGMRPAHDAPTITALKDAGAVILGKTNMHELALEGLSVSTWGGQTLNPFDLTRTPGGSSGGTGAAVAASLAVFGTGTDTVNSLRSPASASSLVSIRPTRGLVSRSGVLPVSYSQDAVGPIARCVEDLAVALTVMKGVGYDERDNTTALAPSSSRKADYSIGLTSGNLRGKRIGWLSGFFNQTSSGGTNAVNDAMRDMQARLTTAGVEFVPVEDPVFNADELLKIVDLQQFEYRQLMDEYLSDPSLQGQHAMDLRDLYSGESGSYLVIPAQYQHVRNALASSTHNKTAGERPSFVEVKQKVANLALALHMAFAANNLDALMYPQQKNLVVKMGAASQSGRNGILAAATGFPSVALPAGFSSKSSTAPEGVPIGMELLGLPWSEAALLQLAYQVESLTRVRRTPLLARLVTEPHSLGRVPDILPDRSRIHNVYIVGNLGI